MFSLDRMAIEDAGPNAERLANAIHLQLGNHKASVQLTNIATALNIIEIRYVPLTSFEGALLTTPERRNGSILINSNARPERQRFTLGHELGHYLNVWHEPPDDGGFMCKSAEVKFGKFFAKQGLSQHEVQELQPIRRLLFDPAPEPMTDNSGTLTRAFGHRWVTCDCPCHHKADQQAMRQIFRCDHVCCWHPVDVSVELS